jgi:transcriptional regulator with GAF, ATPase, and Fis domain
MKSTAAWEREELELVSGAEPAGDEELMSPENNITSLRELTFKLLRKVESIGEVHTPDIDSGVDFYDEVSRFEIDLIKRALVRTAGHQRRAARLLNLKVTTLNSKIKHYNIRLGDSAYHYPPSETNGIETRQRA